MSTPGITGMHRQNCIKIATEDANKALVIEAFDTLFNRRDYTGAEAFTAAARDETLPLPSCVAVISPFADLTFSGASMELRKLADPYVTRGLLESMAADYLGGADPSDPRCSSVFADLHDFPPLLIQVGEGEILFDDAARIRDTAWIAGIDTTFQPWTNGIHVWPVYVSAGLPESALAIEDLAAFLKLHARTDSTVFGVV